MEVSIAAAVLFFIWLSHHRKEAKRRQKLARRRRMEARLARASAQYPSRTLRTSGCEVIRFPRSA